MDDTISLFLMGAAGVALSSLIKMRKTYNDAVSANVAFHWYRTYVRKDAIAIITSFLSVFIWFGIFGEWGKKYPYILDIKMTLFVLAGYGGATLLQFAFDNLAGSAKKHISKVVDVKTNIADIMTHASPTDSLKEVVAKGEALTGVDVTVAPPAPKDVDVQNDTKP